MLTDITNKFKKGLKIDYYSELEFQTRKYMKQYRASVYDNNSMPL